MFKVSKYRAVKVKTEEGTFDSKGEYAHYQLLKKRQFLGEISSLERQKSFPLLAYSFQKCPVQIGKFTADFCYQEGDSFIVEDFKSEATAKTKDFRRTKLIFESNYGIPLRITTTKGTKTAFSKPRKSKQSADLPKGVINPLSTKGRVD